MRDLIATSSPAIVTIECPDINSRGTGFVIGPGGHIVTNNHVVSLIDFPQGTLRVRYSSEIRVISNGVGLAVSLLTDPSEPRPSLVRRPSHWNSLHQMNTVLTDALVQFGNSGGPLIHVPSGRAIAINTLQHEYRGPLVDELVRWRQNPFAQKVPGLTAVMDYVLKYSYVGLNYAISLEHVQDDPRWPLRETP